MEFPNVEAVCRAAKMHEDLILYLIHAASRYKRRISQYLEIKPTQLGIVNRCLALLTKVQKKLIADLRVHVKEISPRLFIVAIVSENLERVGDITAVGIWSIV